MAALQKPDSDHIRAVVSMEQDNVDLLVKRILMVFRQHAEADEGLVRRSAVSRVLRSLPGVVAGKHTVTKVLMETTGAVDDRGCISFVQMVQSFVVAEQCQSGRVMDDAAGFARQIGGGSAVNVSSSRRDVAGS